MGQVGDLRRVEADVTLAVVDLKAAPFEETSQIGRGNSALALGGWLTEVGTHAAVRGGAVPHPFEVGAQFTQQHLADLLASPGDRAALVRELQNAPQPRDLPIRQTVKGPYKQDIRWWLPLR